MASKIVYKVVLKSNTDSVDHDDSDDLMLAMRRRCCSCTPCLGSDAASSNGSWEQIRYDYKEPWWNRGWKRIRKLVAGPKWKTFVRRFNMNGGGGKRSPKFNYDAMSYSLNFDEGPGKTGNLDDDYLYRDFSCRYASIPASAKSLMDWGKDAPSFT